VNWAALTSAITALAAVAALVFTALSLRSTRDQLALSEQGQITERYAKAIEQIGVRGVEHLETRLGGIYALERLAQDSPRDQSTIVQVLSAFVRADLPVSVRDTGNGPQCPPGAPPRVPGERHRLSLDMQAALTVLGRRDHGKDHGSSTDLRNVCIIGIDLTHMRLDGADLSGTVLTGTNLFDANLSGATIKGANLVDAYLGYTNLSGAYLESANLSLTHIEHADLSGAHLDRANLSSNPFMWENAGDGEQLYGASLKEADLSGLNLSHADLRNANLESADLSGADLSYANLSGATHSGAITGEVLATGALGTWW
jgi:uncharacterized protein YjbI with pentapeptide repeats